MEIGSSTSTYVTQFAQPACKECSDTSGQETARAEAEKDPLKDPASPEFRELEKLKQRDREVRAHELAHLAAAGQYAKGGANFTYKQGPDGQRYAVGGEVSIDTSAIPGDPEATIRKLQAVQRAALAPAEPSGQDHSVAAQAVSGLAQARVEASQQASSESDNPLESAPSEVAIAPATATAEEDVRTDNQSSAPDEQQPANHDRRNQEAVQRYQQTASAVDQAEAPILELIA